MTVKQHVINFLDYHLTHNKTFKTHNVQDLSARGILKYGYRLGSPGTYTRQFRYIKNDLFNITKIKSNSSSEATWLVRSKND